MKIQQQLTLTIYRFSMISLVITACNRPDLLDRTLNSLFAANIQEFTEEIIVIEDSGKECNDALIKKYSGIKWLANCERKGQILSVDRAYSIANSEYILHWEEDWLCLTKDAYEFIIPSVELLDNHPEICMVGLRGVNDTMKQPVMKDRDYLYLDPKHKGHWHGFRFNPGLRRKSDWHEIGGYSRHSAFNFKSPADSEIDIAKVYYDRGQVAALLPEKHVEHIGRHRHVIL